MHALRHAQAHDHHAHKPVDHGVRESLASEKRVVGEPGSTGCDWCDATEPLPERLSYARYLERRNTEAIDPPPTPERAPSEQTGGDRGWPSLGDVPAPKRTNIEERLEITYRVRIISPAGRYLDMWV